MTNKLFFGIQHLRCFHLGPVCRQVRLDHPLIWNVDWVQVTGGSHAVIDPADPGNIIYLSDSEYKVLVNVALSNKSKLVCLARAGDAQPALSSITAPKPTSSPIHLNYLRKTRMISRFLKALWNDRFEGKLVQPRDRNIRVLFNHWGKTLRLWSGLSSNSLSVHSDFVKICTFLIGVLKNRGPLGLAIFLKVNLVIINKFLAGQRLDSSWDLKCAVRLSAGLPRWIPVGARNGIRCGSAPVIRVWLSLLYTYKCLHAKGKGSIATIASPPLLGQTALLQEYAVFLRDHWVPSLKIKLPKTWELKPPKLLHSGPLGGTALYSAQEESMLWHFSGLRLSNALREVCTYFDNLQCLDNARTLWRNLETFGVKGPFNDRGRYFRRLKGMTLTAEGVARGLVPEIGGPPTLSKLALLNEAAGKVRVVAMVDYFTQWALSPLHLFLMKILKGIVQDGTFNQNRAVVGASKYAEKFTSPYYSSLDISAATDMIPKQLYRILLEFLLRDGPVGKAVLELMTERDFYAPDPIDDYTRYTRGQPMGALSSFPLLGLVHHSLVQFSAWKVGAFPFKTYSILGDDSVFMEDGQPIVAASYLKICAELGIPISLLKSYQSDRLWCFASRIFFKGVEVTPASLKAELQVRSTGSRVEMALNLLQKGWGVQPSVGSKWLTPATRLLLDHTRWNNLVPYLRMKRLSPVATKALAYLLAPSPKLSLRLGMEGVSVNAYVTTLAGYATALTQQASLPMVTFGSNETFFKMSVAIMQLLRYFLVKELSDLSDSIIKMESNRWKWISAQPVGLRPLLEPILEAESKAFARIKSELDRLYFEVGGSMAEHNVLTNFTPQGFKLEGDPSLIKSRFSYDCQIVERLFLTLGETPSPSTLERPDEWTKVRPQRERPWWMESGELLERINARLFSMASMFLSPEGFNPSGAVTEGVPDGKVLRTSIEGQISESSKDVTKRYVKIGKNVFLDRDKKRKVKKSSSSNTRKASKVSKGKKSRGRPGA
uniref:RNA-dependent RNA polymerase n=1 Tax=Gigaspora rosea mitovirus 4 TaxID=2933360 RepID=A0A9Y0XB48_9VIRU|nr:TPA_asm: RNA-dependent RNA polymerase [Gigaspora rosea mitovirus 4]